MVQGEPYVVKGLKINLLGLPSITDLHLVERLCTTEIEGGDSWKHFPQVFTGLGTFGEEYQIKLKDNATPYALYAPRNVPIPLHPKVQEELNRMESFRGCRNQHPGVRGWWLFLKKQVLLGSAST